MDDYVYEDIAVWLFVSQGKTFQDFVDYAEQRGLTPRKGVTVEKLNDAMRKDRKYGHFKAELEFSMLATYLKTDILKIKR